MATESFDVTELMGLFREALIALLPVMDRSRIQWREGKSHDPWENIERTLYHSIIGSCVENAEHAIASRPIATYGLVQRSYTDRSFLVASDQEDAAFLELAAGCGGFDEAVLIGLGTDLTPTDERMRRPFSETRFLLAVPTVDHRLALYPRIDYEP